MANELDDELPLEPWAIGKKPKDVQFVREFLIDLNAYQAYIRCGHTPSQSRAGSNKFINRLAIQRMIAQAMNERAEELRITAKLVVSETFRCYLGAVAEKNWSAAKGFLEMLGRHTHAWTGPKGLPDRDEDDRALEILSDEELENLARLERKIRGIEAEADFPTIN